MSSDEIKARRSDDVTARRETTIGEFIKSSDEIGIRLNNSRNIIALSSDPKLQDNYIELSKAITDYKKEHGNLYFPLSFSKISLESGDIILREPDKNTKTILKDICIENEICGSIQHIDVDWKTGNVPLAVGIVLMSLELSYPSCIANIERLSKSLMLDDQEILELKKVATAANLDMTSLERICPRINVLQKTSINVSDASLDDIVEKEEGPVLQLESDGDLVVLDKKDNIRKA